VALAFAAAILISASGTTFAWSASTFSSSDEKLLFSLTNRDRAAAGLGALANDSYLHKEAEWRAKDMAVRDYFSHKIPPGNSMVFTYMQRDGYCFKVAGENIGLSSYDDGIATASIEKAFMASKDHRANILGKWARLGVGAYKAAGGAKIFYAVLFSIPCPKAAPKATAKPTAKPTPVPTASPSPSATPSATDSPTPSPSPSATPSTPDSAGATSSNAADAGIETPVSGVATSLRVYEKPLSQGPIDSLFHSLFGGLFGW
jgi:uncharacterized protein YkwD